MDRYDDIVKHMKTYAIGDDAQCSELFKTTTANAKVNNENYKIFERALRECFKDITVLTGSAEIIRAALKDFTHKISFLMERLHPLFLAEKLKRMSKPGNVDKWLNAVDISTPISASQKTAWNLLYATSTHLTSVFSKIKFPAYQWYITSDLAHIVPLCVITAAAFHSFKRREENRRKEIKERRRRLNESTSISFDEVSLSDFYPSDVVNASHSTQYDSLESSSLHGTPNPAASNASPLSFASSTAKDKQSGCTLYNFEVDPEVTTHDRIFSLDGTVPSIDWGEKKYSSVISIVLARLDAIKPSQEETGLLGMIQQFKDNCQRSNLPIYYKSKSEGTVDWYLKMPTSTNTYMLLNRAERFVKQFRKAYTYEVTSR